MRAGFLAGIAVGVGLSLGAAAVAGDIVLHRGLHVRIGDAIASRVQAAVEAEARAQLPAFLADVKEAVPGEVARRLDAQLAAPTLTIGDTRLTVPPAMRGPLETQIRQMIVASLDSGLDAIDTESAVREFGLRTRAMVDQAIAAGPVRVEAAHGVTVPVFLRVR